LHLVGDLDDKVCAVALVVLGGDEVEEADKAKSQVLCLGVLQTLKNDLHDHDKVVLKGSPSEIEVRQ
jgi:hypothetical protein